ncbi:MAG: DUF1553 domain-containing protein [Planctomycetaceae bacterium]
MHNRRSIHAPLCLSISSIAIAIGLSFSFAAVARADAIPDAKGAAELPKEKAADGLTFERDVRPIFRAHCFDCHGGSDVQGKLDLRLRRLIAAGGESGPAIEPGKPEESYLVDRIRNGEMPPGEHKVSAKELAVIEQWIATGAKTARDEPTEVTADTLVTPEDREWWSFRPLANPPIPESRPEERGRTAIDSFLLPNLRAAGLAFSPDAEKLTLLRRAALDLTGLPPTREEVAQFLADDSHDAYERLIDRLLESPHYGERWGRHWLDVAGYADSDGANEQDPERPHAWKYRDYVIRAFNTDKPFDQFIAEQLAGDELAPGPYANLTPDVIEKLEATGYLRMAADGTSIGGADIPVASNQVVADTMKIVSTSLLGLTVGCAQCHDHRYDPIPQEDYYRLRAVFEPALNFKNWRTPDQRRVSLYTDADRALAAQVETEVSAVAKERDDKQTAAINAAVEKDLTKFDPALRDSLRTAFHTPADKRTAEQKAILDKYPSVNINPGNLYQYDQKSADEIKAYDARIGQIRTKKPVEDFIAMLTEIPGNVPETNLFHRGDHRQPKQLVAPGGLTVVAAPGERWAPEKVDPAKLPTSGRRLAFAKWLTNGEHPLFNRAIVNRIWMHHFGRGLVGTPADFGTMGEKPTHPELLDWLAREFPRRGWSMKAMHRLIMTSTAYRQSSRRDASKPDADPENTLYSRMTVRRLDAEIVRDRILAASGSIYSRMFAPPVPVKEDAVGQIVVGIDSKEGANTPGKDIPLGIDESRRSVYVQVRRSRPVAIMRAFDSPVMETNCDRRTISTVATQSLMLMNSDFILNESARFANRIKAEAGDDTRKQVAVGFDLAYNRPAADAEIHDAAKFFESQIALMKAQPPATTDDGKPAPPPDYQLQALTNFCQALLSSSEFLYVD